MRSDFRVLQKFLLYMLLCIGVALTLSGCSHAPCEKYLREMPHLKPIIIKPPPPPVSPFQLRQYYICLLQTHGVQVIRRGQTWILVIPSDDLFINDTAEVDPRYLPVLDIAADFMRTYSKIAVKVTGHSNHLSHEFLTKGGSFLQELTEAQAVEVVRYLTKQRINARLIYAIGKGGLHPVAWSGSLWGRRLNRRIEIEFRYYRDSRAWY